MNIRVALGACFLFWFVAAAAADVYKWVDENGRVHFGDAPPDNGRAKADKVELKPGVVNMSEPRQSAERLQRGASQRGDATAEEHRSVARNRQHRACIELQQRIGRLSGPVRFLDDDGKEIRVTESERRQRLATFQKTYRDQCAS